MTFTAYFIQIAIIAFILAYSSIYLISIKRGTVKPVLATWLFISVATILSFVTNFYESGLQGLLANSYNIVDSVASILIFAFVLSRKDIRKNFTSFEKGCLGAVVLVFVAWLLSGQNVLAHLCLQAILVIAYLPTLVHLWNAQTNTESITTWSLNAFAAIFGVIEPVKTGAILPIVYGVRSILSCLAVIILSVRLQLGKTKPAASIR